MAKQPAMVIDLNSCTNCRACMVACSNANQTAYWDGKFRTTVEDRLDGTERDFLPRICMQCAEAACVNVCPTGASYRDAEGVIRIDADACIGCKACMAACPYGARYVYTPEDVHHARALYGSLAKHTVPHVDKCDLCADRRAGGGQVPACVATCMGQARIFGDLSDPNSEVSRAAKRAVPLGAEYGTKPQVLYIKKEVRS